VKEKLGEFLGVWDDKETLNLQKTGFGLGLSLTKKII